MQKRNIGLDILRIISMMMIIALHILGKGKFITNSKNTDLWQLAYIIEMFCIVAVNCYVLITGYFSIDSKFKWKKVLKIWGLVLFYSISIYLVLILIGVRQFNTSECIKAFFPILTKEYWFVNCYLLLYILSPFLNKFIKSLEKKEFQRLLVILLVVFCILTSILPSNYTLDATRGYGILWFIVLYFVAAYIRIHIQIKHKNYINLCIYMIVTILSIIVAIGLRNISLESGIKDYSSRLFNYNFIFVLISSVALFIYFLNLKVKSNFIKNAVTTVAPLTFAVYLMHEQYSLSRILYFNILELDKYYNNLMQIVIILLDVVFIFAICCIIEYIRKLCVKQFLNKVKHSDT